MPSLLRALDPGRVRLWEAIRTIIAAVAALLVAGKVAHAAHLPGGMTVIATVVAVMVSRSLHGTSLAHRLSALASVPVIGILAAFTGRFMVSHAWLGAALYVAAVWASRYVMRFGGTVRHLGRLALTPLISVMVVPIPPSAAKATGPFWGGLAGLIAVACVVAVQTLLPADPARQAARAAEDFVRTAHHLRTLPPGTRRHTRVERTLHHVALVTEDRLDAALLPDRAPLAALSTALLRAEVLATSPHSASVRAPSDEPRVSRDSRVSRDPRDAALDAALDEVRRRARALRALRAREAAAKAAPAPHRRPGGWRNPQPQARLSLQLAAAMGAAFAVGHVAFHQRWTWTVITAFVVCGAARSRGDVVHRSGLRVCGAVTGALTGTLVAHLVAGAPVLAVTVIFGYLLAGLWLRELNYAIWAFCVTSLLAVLYTLDGETGSALLIQRPEGILLGSACGIAAACFVLPLRTETVMRARAAGALHVLQDLVGAAREPQPEPAAVHRLARALDRATRDLAEAAAPARAHRCLKLIRSRTTRTSSIRFPSSPRPARSGTARGAASSAARPSHLPEAVPAPRPALPPGPQAPVLPVLPAPHPGPAPAAAHAADWADALAACAHAARALAGKEADELATVRDHLGLTALNVGQVRRRLGHRPDATPPRPARIAPPYLARLNSCLADLYERLPAPPVPVPTTSSPASAAPTATAG
ncbi:FUSC family protein [Streptomyces sp. HPF1205]|uniref:FUSC family protein n=1 Tax=Streptomyces sp. HPF1205 TaxID=2873262 RepID=UPI001CED012C|nr:FUSC family protein [Streptomyces sp. HPF1205]